MKKGIDIFTLANKIEFYAEKIAQEIKSDLFLKGKKRAFVSKKIARYLGLLNMLHPFPEGNGRTQRMFLSQLAHKANYDLDWSLVHAWENAETAKKVHRGNDYTGLEIMIDRILIDRVI